jgi:hypothetical protein
MLRRSATYAAAVFADFAAYKIFRVCSFFNYAALKSAAIAFLTLAFALVPFLASAD